MNVTDSLPYILLPLTCMSFDKALKMPFIFKNNVLRSIVDNSGHGTIAFISWSAVTGLSDIKRRHVVEMVLCGAVACAIDLDHFVSAKSLKLKDALTLKHRPPLHSTSILIPILLFIAGLSEYYPSLWTLFLLIALSFISHHVRDGYRRGLWFWPFGSTPPIPYWLYLVLITLLPGVITLIINTATLKRRNNLKTINV